MTDEFWKSTLISNKKMNSVLIQHMLIIILRVQVPSVIKLAMPTLENMFGQYVISK